MGETKVGSVMTSLVQSAPADAPLMSAISRMADQHISCLIVVEKDRPIGILTERDIVSLLANGLSPAASYCLRDVMATPVHCVGDNATLSKAARMMQTRKCRRFPVVNADGNLIGLVTQTDILAGSLRTLEEYNRSTIRAIAEAIDAKSHFTAQHSTRVAHLCVRAGKRLGLSSYEMATLELAAQVHDIGKIGTADEILDKPGQLTNTEWDDILQHPCVGCSILSHIPLFAMVALVVRHHHERYDGTGYPDRLSGDEIPLLARLIAIADAYEAMTADRPYRPALAHEEAVHGLRKNAGIQFDPALVESFIAEVDGVREYVGK